MDRLPIGECLDDLVCPACGSLELDADDWSVRCLNCPRAFPVRRGVPDLVVVESLNPESAREHVTNAVDLDSQATVRRRVTKGDGNPFLQAQARRSMRAVDRLLGADGARRTLISVGSGTGFELPSLLERRRFARVYSCDLAWSATALVPEVVRRIDGALGLFAADFDHLPIRRRPEHLGFIFLALHHAEDPHRSLERLLDHNFDDLVMVEPVSNWFVEVLARLGLARRREYSGLRPEWLDLSRVRRMAHERGYAVRVETWWEIPRTQIPAPIRYSRHAWRPLFWLVEGLSLMLRPFQFGSMAAIRLRRLGGDGPRSSGSPPRADAV